MHKLLWYRLILALVCLSLHEFHHCSGVEAAEGDDTQLDFEFAEVVRIVVDAETNGEIPLKWTFAPSGKTHTIFSEENGALGWQIRDFLASTVFSCALSGESLRIREEGDSEPADLRIGYTNTERLTADFPLEFTLRLDNPAALNPGFYTGRIKILFHSERLEPNKVIGYIPVEILVKGRRINSISFTDLQDGSLDYGSQCDVAILIDAFGIAGPEDTMGSGTLQLFHKTESGNRKLLAVELPLKRPLDPLLELDPDDCASEWRDYAVFTDVSNPEIEGKASALKDAMRYRVFAHVGAAVFDGKVTAQIEWQQDSTAIWQSPLRKVESVAIASGIRVFPEYATIGEPVLIDVVSSASLGPAVDLLLKYPGQKSIPFQLVLDVKSGTTPNRPYRYTGKHSFFPTQTGRWTIQSATNDNQLGHPRYFDVLFRRNGNSSKPLIVFASPTPFWWGWNPDPFKGAGWKETRDGHYSIVADPNLINLMKCRFRESGCLVASSRRKESQFRRIDENNEPVLTIIASEDSLDAKEREWLLPENGIEFSTSVSVPPNSTNQPHARHIEDTYAYIQRGVLQFDNLKADGSTSARIVQVPFSVVVTNQWVQYKEWMGIGTLVIVVAGTMLVFYLKTKNRKQRTDLRDDPLEPAISETLPTYDQHQSQSEINDLDLGIETYPPAADDDMAGFGA